MSNPCHSKAARTRKVTIVKNYLWQWEPQDGRGNWQTPRWPMNSYRARPAEGNYHFWIPLGRFAQYQNSPTIQEVLGDSARDRLGVDVERAESVQVPTKKDKKRAKKKKPETKLSSVNSTTKNLVPKPPLRPKEISTIPFPTGEASGEIDAAPPIKNIGNYFWADSVMERRRRREQAAEAWSERGDDGHANPDVGEVY